MRVSRIYRILRLITILQSGRSYSVDELAAELEVSRRTIFRDLNMLEMAHIPYYFDRERGTYRINNHFFLPPVNLTLDEALAVADLLKSVRNEALSGVKRKKPHLTVDIAIEPDCPMVWADAGQMHTVFVELVRNAFEAGRAAGQEEMGIRIDARRRAGSPGVLVRVVDDGPGMSDETTAAAFTPFFSHRPAGRSRGMGLAQARRRVHDNAGGIWIESKLDEGTTVFVELPSPSGEANG